MCCNCHNNCHNTCWDSCWGCGSSAGTGCGCGCGNNGASTLPIYPDQELSGYYPVYVSVPAFLRRPVAASEVVADFDWGCHH